MPPNWYARGHESRIGSGSRLTYLLCAHGGRHLWPTLVKHQVARLIACPSHCSNMLHSPRWCANISATCFSMCFCAQTFCKHFANIFVTMFQKCFRNVSEMFVQHCSVSVHESVFATGGPECLRIFPEVKPWRRIVSASTAMCRTRWKLSRGGVVGRFRMH